MYLRISEMNRNSKLEFVSKFLKEQKNMQIRNQIE